MFELGVLLAVLAVLGAVARRFALSPIPVYLLAGLSLGNGGILGVAAAGEFIATGAPIGVVLLLLALGLEFSATEFASSLRHHLPSAGVDIVLNAAPGAVAGWLLGLDGVAILGLAGVTYISSSGVIARLLGPASARQPGNAGCAVGAGARRLRDGGLLAAVRGSRDRRQLARGGRGHDGGDRRFAWGVRGVVSLGSSCRPVGDSS